MTESSALFNTKLEAAIYRELATGVVSGADEAMGLSVYQKYLFGENCDNQCYNLQNRTGALRTVVLGDTLAALAITIDGYHYAAQPLNNPAARRVGFSTEPYGPKTVSVLSEVFQDHGYGSDYYESWADRAIQVSHANTRSSKPFISEEIIMLDDALSPTYDAVPGTASAICLDRRTFLNWHEVTAVPVDIKLSRKIGDLLIAADSV